MKKFIALVLCLVLIIGLIQMTALAAPKSFNVPKAGTLPTIDGELGAGEWDNALVIEMKAGDAALAVPAGDPTQFKGATFNFMWSDAGIWFYADVKDVTAPTAVPASDVGSYNAGDGVQFNMFPTNAVESTNGKILFLSYHPKTSDGTPAVGEHFCYSDGATGQNVPEAKIASKFVDGGYIIEGLIPKEALAKSDPKFAFGKAGDILYWNNVIMEEGGDFAQGLICDGEWFAAAGANVYTLTDAVAGKVEAPVVVEEAPAAETPAPVAEEAPAETAPVDNPATGDTGMALILLAVISAAGVFAYTRKIGKKI